MNVTRRTLLAMVTTTSIAGCLGGRDSQLSTDRTLSEATTYVDNGVLDYEGLVDGAAEISDDEEITAIEYTDPEEQFEAAAIYQGEQTDGEHMRMSTDLTAEVPTAFPAPVYDVDSGRFLIHVFANDEFVSFGEWEAWIGQATDHEQVNEVVFEELTAGVQYTVIDPEEIHEIAVVVDPETEPSGVAVRAADRAQSVQIPQAVFEFDTTEDGDSLTIMHAGGDNILADQLYITVGNERVDTTFKDDPVRAGSTVTLDKTEIDGRTVRIIFENDEHGQSATLAEWDA